MSLASGGTLGPRVPHSRRVSVSALSAVSATAVGIVFGLVAFSPASSAQIAAPSLLFQFDSTAANARLGFSVSDAGDVDGDGVPDVIVGARGAVPERAPGVPLPFAGSAFVYSGADGSLIWRFDGDTIGDELGFAVSGAGDVDDDGFADLIVGAPSDDPAGLLQAGSVLVFSGKTGLELWRVGGQAVNDRMGSAVAAAGDVDGDGLPDVLVGAPLADPQLKNGAGSAYVLRGGSGAQIWRLDGSAAGDDFGKSVAGTGDLNGDGRADLFIGSPSADPLGITNAGSAFVYSGLDTSQIWRFNGGFAGDELGTSVARAGRIDADTLPDLIVGAPFADQGGSNAGAAFVYSGATGAQLRRFDGTSPGGFFGFSVSSAGDVNGDGFDDTFVGEPMADPGGLPDAGSAFVNSGSNGALFWRFDGEAAGDSLGWSVSTARDVNHDARADVLLGAPLAHPDALVLGGSAYIYGLVPPPGPPGPVPGAVGLFPINRWGFVEPNVPAFFTLVSLTNVNLAPMTPSSFGGATNVHYQYVNALANPADPFVPLSCSILDRVEFLTPADTLTVLTWCHDGASLPGQEGYLVVSAQNPALFGVDWGFNNLIGSELVINASGAVFTLPMLSFAAQTGVDAGTGLPNPTDVDGDGQLDFDGIEYSAVPDELMLDSFLGAAATHLALVNLTGGLDARNTVHFSAWNDNEHQLSATVTFACWFNEPLFRISPMFTDAFLALNTPNDPDELDTDCNHLGNLETGWTLIDSIAVRTVGGELLSNDGALMGAVTAWPFPVIGNGKPLWESVGTQTNAVFPGP